jgi:SAM-dependent methyltransferase
MGPRLTVERIPALFSSIYEKACRQVIERYYRRVADEIVSELGEGRILDLGTGPGYLPIEIAGKAPLVTVTGVDLSSPFIRMAKKRALKAGLAHRLRFEVGNAAKLRFEDDSFDMVVSTGMLHMLRGSCQGAQECSQGSEARREAWIYDPARVSSQIDKKLGKTLLPFGEMDLPLLVSTHVSIRPTSIHGSRLPL